MREERVTLAQQETFLAVNGLFQTMKKFSIWRFDLDCYTGWESSIRRLARVGYKYEEVRETPEI